ncbi:MAG: 7-carboxy-7-deazaguanine synthase QueE [Bacteroidota bacterium]
MTYLNASNPESYHLMESFYTIQGEGMHAGRAAYFIRLGGCDVRCWWCDVKESWDANAHPEVEAVEIAQRAAGSGAKLAVITGGEPLLHDLTALSRSLHEKGLEVHLETSGSSPLRGEIDWVTLSPKRFKKPIDEIFPVVDELKVVVLTRKDLTWAEENEIRCSSRTHLSLQPEWETPESIPLIIDYVKKNPQWQVSLQTHKFMQIP